MDATHRSALPSPSKRAARPMAASLWNRKLDPQSGVPKPNKSVVLSDAMTNPQLRHTEVPPHGDGSSIIAMVAGDGLEPPTRGGFESTLHYGLVSIPK